MYTDVDNPEEPTGPNGDTSGNPDSLTKDAIVRKIQAILR